MTAVKRRGAPGGVREERRAEVAATIEAAALAAFARHGVDAVTVDVIAEAAAISRRTFYRYFDSPDAVLVAVLCRSMERWGDRVRALPVEQPLLAAFRVGSDYALSAPDNAEPLRLALQALVKSPAAWPRLLGPLQAHMTRRYENVVAARLRALGRNEAPAGAIAAGLAAMLMHLAQENLRQGKVVEVTQFEQTIAVLQELLRDPPA